MPFSEEDRIIIKHYRQMYGWGIVRRFLSDGKNWTRAGIQQHLLEKIDETGTHKRRMGSGRPRYQVFQEKVERVY